MSWLIVDPKTLAVVADSPTETQAIEASVSMMTRDGSLRLIVLTPEALERRQMRREAFRRANEPAPRHPTGAATPPRGPGTSVTVRFSPEDIQAIDAARRHDETRTEAVRRLVGVALSGTRTR